MVKKYTFAKKKIIRCTSPTIVGNTVYELLEKMGGRREDSLIAALWEHWDEAIGEDFAWISPKGHKDNILILFAEDSMEIQELSFLSTAILAKINAWLKVEYFSDLKIDLRIK